jgi:hypothetical protein
MTQLVVVGRKVNTWAWGLEEALRLKAMDLDVTILDFGENKWPKSNPRTKFQKKVLDSKGIRVIPWTALLSKDDFWAIAKEARKVSALIGQFENWDDFEYNDLPVGRILMSSYARVEGARKFPLSHVPPTMRHSVIKQVLVAHYTFRNLKIEIDQIIFSNGRGPTDATILAMARKVDIKWQALESGANSGKYFVYENSPHFAPDWWVAIKEFSKSTTLDEMKDNAVTYWTKKLNGLEEFTNRDWSKGFERGSLPINLPKRFVTYFCTSEHEVPVFDDFEEPRPEFKTQAEAVKTLAKVCREMGLNLVIKRHPNSISKGGSDNEKALWEWAENSKEILYLDPHSKFDTYALLKQSTAVLSYKSSTGIEAAALGIPSRSLGPAKWAFTDKSRADSTEKIVEFLKKPECLDANHAQTWGAFMNTFGRELTVFSQVKGGFALAQDVKFFASDYYVNPMYKLFEKLRRRFVNVSRQNKLFGG